MPWSEFCSLISGLMSDTPLGQVVEVRAEKDPKTIKGFSPEQRRIYKDWQSRKASKMMENPENLDSQMEKLSRMLEGMFGKGGK